MVTMIFVGREIHAVFRRRQLDGRFESRKWAVYQVVARLLYFDGRTMGMPLMMAGRSGAHVIFHVT